MTTHTTGARRAAEYTSRPLAASILAELLWRTTSGRGLPDGDHPAPRPAARAESAGDGAEALVRGPAAASFR